MKTRPSGRFAPWAALLCLALVPILSPALAGAAADRERPGTSARALLPAADDRRMERLAEAVRELAPEGRIREIYADYERAATASGHPFRIDVLDATTVAFADFARYEWLDVLSPHTGWWLDQNLQYYEAPWLDEVRVFYDIEWVRHAPRGERTTFAHLEEAAGKDLRQVFEGLLAGGQLERPPVAVTSCRVRVSFAGRERTYRAAGFWYAGEDGGIDLEVDDPVVPHVDSPPAESARVVTRDELGRRGRAPDTKP